MKICMLLILGMLVMGLLVMGCFARGESTPCEFASVAYPDSWVFCPNGINATFNCAGLSCPPPGVACDIGVAASAEPPCEPSAQ
jgi:hypothetical protein